MNKPILCVCILISLTSFINAAENDELEKALSYLKFNDVNIESLKLDYTIEEDIKDIRIENLESSEKKKNIQRQVFFSSGNNKRLDIFFAPINETSDFEHTSTSVYNGEEVRTVDLSSSKGSITSQDVFPMSYNEFVYGLEISLFSYLSRNASKAIVSKENIDGKEMTSISVIEDSSETVLILDPSYNYQLRMFRLKTVSPEHVSKVNNVAQSIYEINVKSYLKVDDYYFPSVIESRFDSELTNGKSINILSRKLVLHEAHPNVPIPPDTFDVDFSNIHVLTHYDLGITHLVSTPTFDELSEGEYGIYINEEANMPVPKDTKTVVLPQKQSRSKSSDIQKKDAISGDITESNPNDKSAVLVISITLIFLIFCAVLLMVKSRSART